MNAQTALLDPVAPPPAPDAAAIPDGAEIFGVWKFEVRGEAVPQGSMTPFIDKRDGIAKVKPSNAPQLKAWRKLVAETAAFCKPPWLTEPWDGPIALSLIFIRERNASDYLADGTTLRKGARRYPETAPDGDKCDRAIWDALTGVAFTNDARVVSWGGGKRFAALDEDARTLIDVTFLR